MTNDNNPTIKPGNFAVPASDQMRIVYDNYNEQIVTNRVPVTYVFIGESITQFWDLQSYFGRAGSFVVNRGVSGDITLHMSKRFEADVLQLNPSYVHIMGGTNNTWRLDAVDPRERKTFEQIHSETISHFAYMIHEAKRRGIVPIIGSNLPTGKGIPCFDFKFLIVCPNNSSDLRNKLIVQINNGLRQLAAQEQIIYVDYHSHMTERDGITLLPGLADDELHPNVYGYNIMAGVLCNTLHGSGLISLSN